MTTKNIYERVAELHNTTSADVEQEICAALQLAGLDADPLSFIQTVAAIVKSE